MELQTIINSPGMWLASSVMVITIIVQSALFLRKALVEAKKMNLDKQRCIRAARAAAITAVGPSLSPVIVMIALIPILGGPNAWMRVIDIGAPQTELAVAALASKIINVDLRSPAFNLEGYSYAMWGQALNNVGWLLVAFFGVHRMGGALQTLNTKCNPIWIKWLMAGAAMGLYGYLLAGQVVPKSIRVDYLAASIFASIAMCVIVQVSRKFPILREPAIGLSMLAGMWLTQAFFGKI